MIEYFCPECGEEWESELVGDTCPVCEAEGRIKPPAPDGEVKIRP